MNNKKIALSLTLFLPLTVVLIPTYLQEKITKLFDYVKTLPSDAKRLPAELKGLAKQTIYHPIIKFLTAVEEGKHQRVKAFLAFGVNVNVVDMYGNNALMLASDRGDRKMIKVLLDADANVNSTNIEGNTALMRAAREGYPEILFDLLKAGAKKDMVDNKKRTALDYALLMQKGNPDKEVYAKIIKLLEL